MRNYTNTRKAIAVLLMAAILMGSFVTGVAANTIFKDVNSNDWFCNDVIFVSDNGLMQGVAPDRFDPNSAATRAMMATIFWRFEGTPEPAAASGFRDVPEGEWYSKAIAWMKETELTNGAGNNKYGTNDPVTREELATFFYRYATFKGYDVEKKNSLSNYSDFGKIHGWALEGLSWANANGIVNGRSATKIAPQDTATRAEIAAMIHRFITNVVETQVEPTEEPTDAPTEPSVEPTEPTDATEVTEPTDAPTESSDEPTEATEAPTEPTADPTEPTEPSETPTDAPTEPTDSPIEPTNDPTEPTVPIEPTEPSGGVQLPFELGDCVVLYNPANNVVTAYAERTGDGTRNLMTGRVTASETELKVEGSTTETLYVVSNGDGTYSFIDQWDYDDRGVALYLAAEAPSTFHSFDFTKSSFEIIEAEGGYLLKNVADNSYFAVENGLVVAKDLIEGDPNFLFWFAVWGGEYEETGPDTVDLICTLVGGVRVEPTEPTEAPPEPTEAPTEPTEAPTEPTEEPTEPTEPVKTATVILMVDDVYGDSQLASAQALGYGFRFYMDSSAAAYGAAFDEHGLAEGLDERNDLYKAFPCLTIPEKPFGNSEEERVLVCGERSIEVPVGTYDIFLSCGRKPGVRQRSDFFVPENCAFDDFEIEEGKVYVFYLSAKGYNVDSYCLAGASFDYLGPKLNGCTGTAVTLFVGDGEKPEIDTAQLPHCHNWEKVEHEQVRIGIYKIRCSCGEWTSCCYTSENQGDVLKDWEDHYRQYPRDEQIYVHGSYAEASYGIIVSPAYYSWVCSDCGEERWVSPGALNDCTCHTWERVRFREHEIWCGTCLCSCGWESRIHLNDASYAFDYYDFLTHKTLSEIPSEHKLKLSPQRLYVANPSYDVWICTHCGKVSNEQPEADECNHVDPDKVWMYSVTCVCEECGWKVTTDTSKYYGDLALDCKEHFATCQPGKEIWEWNRRNGSSMLCDDCWTLIQEE
ncbi:MAG: S-layer homology domain-containing protein [Oscillospiraceae bacterium]|nr:S-layer homology domain-containing protein [Oscillospiraceae bacterium]